MQRPELPDDRILSSGYKAVLRRPQHGPLESHLGQTLEGQRQLETKGVWVGIEERMGEVRESG